MKWQGVFPAITTPFQPDYSIDHAFLGRHVRTMLDAGCQGIVALGSLGEGQTLTKSEKLDILKTCKQAAGRTPLVAGISALSTSEAADLARAAEAIGCEGLMVLPVYVYRGDWRETEAHFRAVIAATKLPCMLYNNPVAYGTDVTPEQGIAAGAVGWIAGLVNALPRESVELFDLARAGKSKEARELYEWFLPLLRLDTVPKFVQLIKLVQEEAGLGSERVRPPRLVLAGREREEALHLIRKALDRRPALSPR
jgi:1-pyrroline-4-hydroxy-2-carboxylate deaminase